VSLAWETVSETSNAGFNVYRATSEAGPWAKVNPSLIPAVAPGSAEGHTYAWTDATASASGTYFYALEDVSASGATTRHDPVSVTIVGPNAVQVTSFAASTATLPAIGGLLALIGLAAGAATVGRRKGTRS
jgi:hypothetical protein